MYIKGHEIWRMIRKRTDPGFLFNYKVYYHPRLKKTRYNLKKIKFCNLQKMTYVPKDFKLQDPPILQRKQEDIKLFKIKFLYF